LEESNLLASGAVNKMADMSGVQTSSASQPAVFDQQQFLNTVQNVVKAAVSERFESVEARLDKKFSDFRAQNRETVKRRRTRSESSVSSDADSFETGTVSDASSLESVNVPFENPANEEILKVWRKALAYVPGKWPVDEHKKVVEGIVLPDFLPPKENFVLFEPRSDKETPSHYKSVRAEQKFVGAAAYGACEVGAQAFDLMTEVNEFLKKEGMSQEARHQFKKMFTESPMMTAMRKNVTTLASKFNELSVSRRKHLVNYWYYDNVHPQFEEVVPGGGHLFDPTAAQVLKQNLQDSGQLKSFRKEHSGKSKQQPNRSGQQPFRGRRGASGGSRYNSFSAGFNRGSGGSRGKGKAAASASSSSRKPTSSGKSSGKRFQPRK
jgi:hypothetical protein